ncbi:MAG: 2-succinyl-5-enolpyruvyl-6-hydroxy-3-cyclohexene-1-carboxylic-acid synthase [Candidatus Limnocylindrales bacterium]|jgi:2-succinyl-5-enolpyruvyl-6-hydroxy-3-cyclohexene-1-carboxylate synthase
MTGRGSGPSPLRAFVEELARAGVRDAVVCPGSRSTALALALRAHDRIRVRVLIDERSAGFFALGMARTTRRAVVLLGTSGSAAVNFAPAVVEASLGRVPLVALTADRPAELRDRGAPQTIDQLHLYGRHAKWFADLDLMAEAPDTLAHVRSVAGRAVATALEGPAGPVHLNLPLREPLIPSEELGPLAAPNGQAGAGAPFTAALTGRRTLTTDQSGAIARRLAARERGLIVAGPLDDPACHEPIARLAAVTGYPILADPLSGLRCGPHDRSLVLAHADHVVRPGPWIEAHGPEIVVRFGAMPTSRPVTDLMKRAQSELFVVDGGGGWREAALVPATMIHADEASAARALAESLAGELAVGPDGRSRGPGAAAGWTNAWLEAEAAADRALDAWLEGLEEPFEGAPFKALGELLPAGALLWAGSSMPVRDMDAWLPRGERALRVLANRGANGIDGVTSTALGSAAVSEGPVVLVVGDVSFLHDLGALVAARLHAVSLLVVLIDNGGGGIFSLLPQAATVAPGAGLPTRFEELFGTPHGIELRPIVEGFGFRYIAAGAAGYPDLRAVIEAELGRPGVRVVELRTDRARNARLHQAAAAAVASALAALAGERTG